MKQNLLNSQPFFPSCSLQEKLKPGLPLEREQAAT
jgi:hypothetical protein